MYHVAMSRDKVFTDPIQVFLEHDDYLWLKREAWLTGTDYAKIVRMLIRKYKAKRTKA